MIVNSANLQVLFTGFKAAFNTGFRDTPAYWEKVATMVTSTTTLEKYAWLGQFPRLREWLGDRVIKILEAHDYTIKNKDFESTIAVGRNEIEDDTYGIYNPMFQEMGFAAKTHPDELVFGLLALGFASLCYDGQYYFDSDHPVRNSDGTTSSVTNVITGSKNPWFLLDTRRPLKPIIFQKRREYQFTAMTRPEDESVFMRKEYRYGIDARVNVGFGFWQQAFGVQDDLVPATFNEAYDRMSAFKSDEGRPLGILPNLLVCGPSNREYANECIKAERLANGASNTNRDLVDVLVVPWLQ
ncbi:Mu-like prophage major head subunit gpT family protein [Geomonas sp. Red32]|uniref:Mu-like prophage major head subunit gpT family protein n=1 Tax=Geomonas sp. Red32 TaxID=2912856 RepID=UPI00202CF2EB|nr:Mu-like prophage major head subunit gpT family protein [Geomonas sp. Red32]MCM0081783.1 Mu-like prophage major head subunit gpT family protein [Geomonas sp. Red32]